VAGGEYGDATHSTTAEVYDPFGNTWTYTQPAGVEFADSECVLLPDGKVLVSGIYSGKTNVIYNPAGNNWLPSTDSIWDLNEATWVKLPDDSILSIDPYRPPDGAYGTNSERYIPSLDMWITDANVPVNIYDIYNGEQGPGLLLPDGRAFFLGANGFSVLYTPSGGTNQGRWTRGPVIPDADGIPQGTPDAPGAMMINGKALCAVSPRPQHQGDYPPPTSFFEYDYSIGTTGAFTRVSGPTGLTDNICSEFTAMLVLPDGNILYSHQGTDLYVYDSGGPPLPAAKPTIQSITANLNGSFHLVGTLLNGLSQGASYGDDLQMDSNYPLVRLTDNVTGNIIYGRTFNWSSTSVRTGNKLVSTEFIIPDTIYNNGASLVVVANGVASDPVSFPQAFWVDFNYTGSIQNGSFGFPYRRLTNGVSAVPSGGTILIRSAGHSAETTKIIKAMKINSPNGPAVIGR
jgi:hypothetical protein